MSKESSYIFGQSDGIPSPFKDNYFNINEYHNNYTSYLSDNIKFPSITFCRDLQDVHYYNTKDIVAKYHITEKDLEPDEDDYDLYTYVDTFNKILFYKNLYGIYPSWMNNSPFNSDINKLKQWTIVCSDFYGGWVERYKYLKETFEFNDQEYYLWEYVPENSSASYPSCIKYILTDTLNFEGKSLEDNIDNNYNPIKYILDEDLAIYDAINMPYKVLIKVRKEFHLNKYLYLDVFRESICEGDFDGDYEAFKTDTLNNLSRCNKYKYLYETIEFNNKIYYLWEFLTTDNDIIYNNNINRYYMKFDSPYYLLTDSLDLYKKSLEYNINNTNEGYELLFMNIDNEIYGQPVVPNNVDNYHNRQNSYIISFKEESKYLYIDNFNDDDVNMYDDYPGDIISFETQYIGNNNIDKCNIFKYTNETFEYNNNEYYLYEMFYPYNENDYYTLYILTNTLVFNGLTLEDNIEDNQGWPSNLHWMYMNLDNDEIGEYELSQSYNKCLVATRSNCKYIKLNKGQNSIYGYIKINNNIYTNSHRGIIIKDGKSSFYKPGFYEVKYNLNEFSNIGINMFKDISNLFSIKIPDNITTIGNSAFQNCTNLRYVHLSKNLTTFGTNIFSGCTNLPIKGYIRYAGSLAHNVTSTSRTTYTVKKGTQYLYTSLFDHCTNATTIELPDGITYIGEKCFYYCNKLNKIRIPYGVKSLGIYTFSNTKLTSVGPLGSNAACELPTSIESLEIAVFQFDRNITTVEFPEGLKTIGNYCLDGCNNITSVILPSTLTNIGQYVFKNCSKLESITFRSMKCPTFAASNALSGIKTGGTLYAPIGGTGYNTLLNQGWFGQYNWTLEYI